MTHIEKNDLWFLKRSSFSYFHDLLKRFFLYISTSISKNNLTTRSDQEIHEDDRHQKQEDEENDANVDVERLQVVLEEDVVEFDLAERHHYDVQEHRIELENFLQQPITNWQHVIVFRGLGAALRLPGPLFGQL